MRTGTLKDLAAEPGMPSTTTLWKIIKRHADFPVIRWGTRGYSFELDLDAAAKFVNQVRAGQISSPVVRARWCEEHGLDYMGGGDG